MCLDKNALGGRIYQLGAFFMGKNMSKKLNIGYGAIFGSYWIVYAIIASFSSVFMLAKGYSNSQIGMTLAAANVLAVIMQPLVADFTDRSKKLGIMGATEIMTAAMMIFTVGMFAFKGGTLGLCAVFALLIAFHTVLQPLFNSFVFHMEGYGYDLNFGIARSVGSLAYSIFVAIFGSLVQNMGIGVMPAFAEISCFILLLSLAYTGKCFNGVIKSKVAAKEMLAPNSGNGMDEDAKISSNAITEPEEITLSMFIKRNKMFTIMNLAVIGIYFSNAAFNNYTAQIVMNVGGTTEDMGRILAVMAFLEIPTMVFFKQLKNKFSCQFLLKVASVGFTLKIAIIWLAPTVLVIYVAQVFQMVSLALFLPGMVYFTNEMMSKGEAVKGQALYTIMITVTTIFASLLGGWVLDVAGAKTLTFIATLATAAGAILLIAVIDKVKKS